MDADKIVLDLSRRFSAPLPEFYKRRIVFWYDEEQKFTDQIDELVLDNVKIVKLTGSNLFAVKRLLTIEDTASNYLVYCPVAYESPRKKLAPQHRTVQRGAVPGGHLCRLDG